MDLAGRIAKGRKVDGGTWVVPLGTALKAASPSLADVRVEIRAVGNTLLAVSSPVETGPRPPAFWRTLGEEVHAFLGSLPSAAELAVLGHVIRGLGPHPARERLERRVLDILEAPIHGAPSVSTAPPASNADLRLAS